MHAFICVYSILYAYIWRSRWLSYVCMYLYTCMRVGICVCIVFPTNAAHTRLCVRACIFIRKCMYTRMHAYTRYHSLWRFKECKWLKLLKYRKCIHTCIHACIHTHATTACADPRSANGRNGRNSASTDGCSSSCYPLCPFYCRRQEAVI